MTTPQSSQLRAASERMAAVLNAQGTAATVDPRAAVGNLPCVLVPPPSIVPDLLDGNPTYSWQLIAAAATSIADVDTIDQLSELVEGCFAAFDVERAEPIAWRPPTGGDPLPAYRITVTGDAQP